MVRSLQGLRSKMHNSVTLINPLPQTNCLRNAQLVCAGQKIFLLEGKFGKKLGSKFEN
jgi:hypothetical protein